jgi:hypothetical protein
MYLGKQLISVSLACNAPLSQRPEKSYRKRAAIAII